jgi:cold shock protein
MRSTVPRGRMMPTGTVTFFSGERGFGYVKPDDGGADVFVHHTAMTPRLRYSIVEKQRIAFDVAPDRRGSGLQARNIKLIDEASSSISGSS